MGGIIAMNLARRHPEIPAAVVLIDAPLGLPESVLATRDAVLAGFESPAYQTLIDGFGRQFFFNDKSPPHLVEEVIANAKLAPQRVLATALASSLDTENDVPGQIPVPSLFIRAETHLASPEDLQVRFPGMQLHTVGCAHFVQMEKPEETNRMIDEFLEKLS
jgi:pimeloyl-ACP methyl ester carboxylesterase